VLVVAPVIASVLVSVMELRPQVAIALVALAISPLPPLLPRRGEKAGGHVQYGLGLVLVLANTDIEIDKLADAIPQQRRAFERVTAPIPLTITA